MKNMVDATRLLEIEKAKNKQMEAELIRLRKRERILDALEGGGVDNWVGYDDAMEYVDDED
jgi:hypothetical protein